MIGDHCAFPITIKVKVTPKAKFNKIKVEHMEDGTDLYRIYVTQAPDDGKANQAVIKLLAKELGVAKSRISVKKGQTNREKILEITE